MHFAANLKRLRQRRLIVWQRVKSGWRSSTGTGLRRRTNRWKFFARITAEPINCPSPAAGSMVNGAMTGPAAWSRPRWSAGGCRAPARSEPRRSQIEAISVPMESERGTGFRLMRFLDANRSHRDQARGGLSPENASAVELCQNATEPRVIFTFGTAMERIAPESLIWRRTPLFTARCRPQSEAAHHIQHHNNRPQPATDDKG